MFHRREKRELDKKKKLFFLSSFLFLTRIYYKRCEQLNPQHRIRTWKTYFLFYCALKGFFLLITYTRHSDTIKTSYHLSFCGQKMHRLTLTDVPPQKYTAVFAVHLQIVYLMWTGKAPVVFISDYEEHYQPHIVYLKGNELEMDNVKPLWSFFSALAALAPVCFYLQ